MLQNKYQFDVFDYEEDGSFKPIFMVGKCAIEKDATVPQSPIHVIEEEQKEILEIEIEQINVKAKEKKLVAPIKINLDSVNLKIDTPTKA